MIEAAWAEAGRWVQPGDADQRLTPKAVISEPCGNQLGRAPINQVPIVLHTGDGWPCEWWVAKATSRYDMPTVPL